MKQPQQHLFLPSMVLILLSLSFRRTSISAFQSSSCLNFQKSCQRRTLSVVASAAAGGKEDKEKVPQNVYHETILLPVTTLNQRANAVIREPEIQSLWKEMDLYNALSKEAASNDASLFVLHDGPPYANGDLHCGHALNKILKDIINRYMSLWKGKQVHYIPGWDCHGLPIELKVLQQMNKDEREALTPVTLRQKAATFAKETVLKQSQAFQRYGIMGDFNNPYLTLQPEFEAAQIRVFGQMFEQGYIFRGRKPVHWSPSSQTALAEAELEYPDSHISKSIYVAFDVVEPSEALALFTSNNDDNKGDNVGNNLKVAIWTTTPWTIPANLAIAVNPALDYSVAIDQTKGTKLIVATQLLDTLAQKLKTSFEILATVKGQDLVGTKYRHPLYGNHRISPVVAGGDYITTESGTGLVHTAPGHGQEDYVTGLKYGLDLLSPVNDVGQFTAEAGLGLEGMSVLTDGNFACIQKLDEAKALLLQEDYNHKYPYDWRTKKPTIFRATYQWFASVQGFRDQALAAIETVQWVPALGINRIKSFVAGRGDWCISRQRSWGVPIPVFYDDQNEVLLNKDTIAHIEAIFAQHGSDAWWTMDVADLLPEKYKDQADQWKKGTDTMDVWFDSGSSWAGVVKTRKELSYPADLYLEGSDQHRGWFQSSLLTSVANTGKAPFKTVLTHGFVLDEKGFKMSKSLGNVVDPKQVIEGGNNKKKQPAYGADVLRLWVANSDYSSDVLIGDGIIQQTFESYRKLRNTARYMIGNLDDFDPTIDAVPYDDLPSLDKYLLGKLSKVLKDYDEAMGLYKFQVAVQELLRFATSDLSNFYLDVAKDRLYISGVGDARRRSCQTVLYHVLHGTTKALAPILPHTAEDVWQNLPYATEHKSVFQGSRDPQLLAFPAHDEERWLTVRSLRDDVNKCMEAARSDKLLGASLEAATYVFLPNERKRDLLKSLVGDDNLVSPPIKTNGVDELRTALMMSQVHVVDSVDDITNACEPAYILDSKATSSGATVGVRRAAGSKCGRCWFYDDQVGKHGLPFGPDLCQRCDAAISMWQSSSGKSFQHPLAEKQAASVSSR